MSRASVVYFCVVLFLPAFAHADKLVTVHNEEPKGGDGFGLKATSLHLVKELQFGDEESEDAPVLARVSDIAVDAQGRIYVAEAAQNMILVYDEDGAFIRQIGRAGEGPGEFLSLEALAFDAHRNLLAVDRQNVSTFDSSGVFVERFSQRLYGMTRGIVVGDAGDVFLSCWTRSGKIIHKFAPDGTELLAFADSYPREDPGIEQTYAGGPIDRDPQGNIWYSQMTPYEIRKFSPDGQPLMIIERENRFMIPPKVERNGDVVTVHMFTGSFGFCVLTDGRLVNAILVTREQQDQGMPASFIDVFDAGGHLTGSVPVDPASNLLGRDRHDRLYFVQYGEPIAITRYRLKN